MKRMRGRGEEEEEEKRRKEEKRERERKASESAQQLIYFAHGRIIEKLSIAWKEVDTRAGGETRGRRESVVVRSERSRVN